MFQLTKEEMAILKCQNGIASWGGDRHFPYAFTENGVAMLSGILRSETAVDVNIRIMRAFTAMRQFLDKRKDGVSATIYTHNISQQLRLDIARHNAQYAIIDVQSFNKAHDRFLLIDKEVYHIGASIKDLGKKWFAFTLLRDMTAAELLKKIQTA